MNRNIFFKIKNNEFVKDEKAVSVVTGIILLIAISVVMFGLLSGSSLTTAGKLDKEMPANPISYKVNGNMLTFIYSSEKIPIQSLGVKVVNDKGETIPVAWNVDYIQSGMQIVNYNSSAVNIIIYDKKLGKIYLNNRLAANPDPAPGNNVVGFEKNGINSGKCTNCSINDTDGTIHF